MESKAIFLPAVAMATLTLMVWLRMFFLRVGQMKRTVHPPAGRATSSQATARLTDSREPTLPNRRVTVLFYLLWGWPVEGQVAPSSSAWRGRLWGSRPASAIQCGSTR